jgi:hypothetical protein
MLDESETKGRLFQYDAEFGNASKAPERELAFGIVPDELGNRRNDLADHLVAVLRIARRGQFAVGNFFPRLFYEPFEEVVGGILGGDFLGSKPSSVEIDFPADRIEEDFPLFSRKGFEIPAILPVSKVIEKENAFAFGFRVEIFVFKRFDRFQGVSVFVGTIEYFRSGEFFLCRFDGLVYGRSDRSSMGNEQIRTSVFSRVQGNDSDLGVRPSPDGFENFLGERPLFAYHSHERPRVVDVFDEPGNGRIFGPTVTPDAFEQFHSPKIQMRLYAPEGRESELSLGVGFRAGLNGRHEILKEFSKPFLFHGVGLTDFFDGKRVSRNAAVYDPNVNWELFEPTRSFEEGLFPISAEIRYGPAEGFDGIPDSLGDGVS